MPTVTESTPKADALARLREARRALTDLEGDLDAARDVQAAAALRAREAGATYTEVGEALGVSKQRAFDLVAAARDA